MFRRPSKAFEDAVMNKGRIVILGIESVLLLEGGVPIMSAGKIIGAIGISVADSEQDALPHRSSGVS